MLSLICKKTKTKTNTYIHDLVAPYKVKVTLPLPPARPTDSATSGGSGGGGGGGGGGVELWVGG